MAEQCRIYVTHPIPQAARERLCEACLVVLAPHIASATTETRARMVMMAAQNVFAAMRGEVPPNIVNPEVMEGR